MIGIGTLAIGAGVAAGFEPGRPTVLPEEAFVPVTVPSEGASSGAIAIPTTPETSVGPILEPLESPPPAADRPQPSLPSTLVVVPVAPRPTAPPPTSAGGASTTHVLVGRASWYCRAGISPCTVNYPDTSGFQAYAAAGPKLRAALGSGWRGRIVSVNGISVKLIDWCQCYQGQPDEKLLDLYYDVFARTGSAVTIRW